MDGCLPGLTKALQSSRNTPVTVEPWTYGSVPFRSLNDFVSLRSLPSYTNQVCFLYPIRSQATQSPNSNGMLKRGVGGRFLSSSALERSLTENRQFRISLKIRSRRLLPPGISRVALGTN